VHLFLSLAFLLAPIRAAAGPCPPESLVLYSNQDLRLRLMSHEHPAARITVRLYSKRGGVVDNRKTDRDGIVAFGIVAEGNYEIFASRWGRLNLKVRPERGANGPWFTWFVPAAKVKSANGNKTSLPACPVLTEVED